MLKDLRHRLKQKLSFLTRRLREPPRPRNEDGKVLLHIGCGKINSPEFLNIDAQPYAHVHIVTENIAELSQFADESVDLVYMCHILEHIKMSGLAPVLQEMKRVLRTNGVLRLSVPDFDRLIDVYQAGGGNTDVIHLQLMGGQDSDYNVHYSVFNRKGLSALLQKAGFREVRAWDPRNCEHHDFKDKACKVMSVGGQSFEISLNLEAVK